MECMECLEYVKQWKQWKANGKGKKKILCGRNVIISERLKWLLLIITYLLSKVM